tara:strand:- start:322 stop:1011 length:690 start_codon:yes stop_codon:yes gene_type:complete
MDGNGRWANINGLPRIAGHRRGVRAVRKITKTCGKLGIKTLTLYTFSSENWNRPIKEVSALMKLLLTSIRNELNDLISNNVRFTVIGEISKLDEKIQFELKDAINKTKNNTGINLNLALSYSSRNEIINAVKLISKEVLDNKIKIDDINTNLLSKKLYTKNIPDPDLLIRTGGEFRVSNFLLWQIAYTEVHVTKVYWPEFDEEELLKAIFDFQNRERRFGKISEQINTG